MSFSFWASKSSFKGKRINVLKDMIAEMKMNILTHQYFGAMSEFYGKSNKAIAFEDLETKLRRKGARICDAFSGYYSVDELLLIEVGENTNRLKESLGWAIKVNEARQAIFGLISKSLILPMYFIITSIVGLGILATSIAPSLMEVGTKEENMGIATRFALYCLHTLENHPYSMVLGIISIFAASIWSMSNWRGKTRAIAEKFLPHYMIYRQFCSVYFMIVFSAMIRAQLPPKKAVQMIQEKSTPYLADHMAQMAKNFGNGLSLAESIDTGLMPKDLIARIDRYDRNKIAEQFISELGDEGFEQMLNSIRSTLKPITTMLILISGTVIIGVAFDFAGMFSSIKSGIGF
jgi:type II secretory pathway component PulF